MTAASPHAVVLCTAGSLDQAGTIARGLLERRLAACVNIVEQMCSLYWWEGAIQRESECLMVIKTRAELFPTLRDAIRELHTYDTPEIVMLPIADGDPKYLEWLSAETSPEPRQPPS